jgi:large subunit ribosomal protein L37Ae
MSHRAKSPLGGMGARYGRSVRAKIGRIQTDAHQRYVCTVCANVTVERSSVGLWKCDKCGNTFAGGAYTPTTKIGDVAKRSAK